ncbi:MAG: TatD family hydrolase [Gammaproteobacteria bacterium]|nr:TatD family hydrolase [Gammaproteobacteria bacterium]
MLVDSHCHIPMLGQDMEVDEVIANAKVLGVEHMLCVSVDLETYPEILSLAEQYDCIYASVGVHPNTRLQEEVTHETLVQLASNDNVIAIGETGLDYFRSEGDLDWQRERFRTHIRAAKSVNKPLIIHTRDVGEDITRILQEEGANEVGGVMHCFVEDWEIAQKAMELNFYISFSGIVTFKNAKEVQEVAKQVPLERMLVETDSPYLTPAPYRGRPNQPGYTRYVAEFIAELHGTSLEQVADQTTANFFKLFKINKRGLKK